MLGHHELAVPPVIVHTGGEVRDTVAIILNFQPPFLVRFRLFQDEIKKCILSWRWSQTLSFFDNLQTFKNQ